MQEKLFFTVKILFWVKAMESVTVETVTVMLVGMAINVNSSVTSLHGRSRGGARLQMARSAATEVCCSHLFLWTYIDSLDLDSFVGFLTPL